MSKIIRIAVIGTGGMAKAHVENFKKVAGCAVVAACDVLADKAAVFAGTHGIENSFDSVEKLYAWGAFDAVTIVTPDASHAPLSLQALRHDKHVLCEKPLALNAADAETMVKAARKAKKVNMVNLSYRNWSALEGVASLVAKGVIGDLRHVEASYLQAWLPSKIWGDWRTNPTWLWRLSSKHGSKGVLGDVGVHIFDFATHPAGGVKEIQCRLKAFPKAKGDRVGEYVLDANDSATAMVEFKNGALGVIHTTRWCGGHANRLFLKISGTKGSVEIDSARSQTAYRICAGKDLDTCTWKDVEVPPVPSIYQRFVTSILKKKTIAPDFARGWEVQKMLDACWESDKKRKPVAL